MDGDVSVSLLVTVVFGDVVEVIPPDDDSALHLVRDDNALEDLSPDGDVAGEGAFLIDVGALDGFLRSLEA